MVPYLLTLLVFAAAVALHFLWRGRYKRLKRERDQAVQQFDAAQKRYYQESAQSQAEQQALFNSMTEGVLVLDQTGRVQLVNRSLQEFFALRAEVRGQTIMETFRLQELGDIARRLPQERIVQAHELELPGVQGRCLEVNAAAVFDRDGTQLGSLFVFHDLTRIK